MALFKREPVRYKEHWFDSLPVHLHAEAQWRYWRCCQRHGGKLRTWQRPLIYGQIRRWLRVDSGTRRLMAKRLWHQSGGAAAQRQFQVDKALLNKPHPLEKARAVLQRRRELAERGPLARMKWLPIA
jgi:hypothetical protein